MIDKKPAVGRIELAESMLRDGRFMCRAEMNDLRERHLAEAAKLVNQ